MLLQQCRDLIRTPQLVVDLAVLSLSHRREFNYTYMLAGLFVQQFGDDESLLFSLLSFVESMVLLRTLTATPHASLSEQSSL